MAKNYYIFTLLNKLLSTKSIDMRVVSGIFQKSLKGIIYSV